MSKAFTKEDDEGEEVLAEELEPLRLPPGARNYMTPAGAARLQAELERLREERAALAGGGLDSGPAMRRLRAIDARIRGLTQRLDLAEVVDPAAQRADEVRFGARVTVRDAADEGAPSRAYRIVGVDEADAGRGDVSWLSPMARALLGAQVGDVVSLATPRGEEDLEILRLEYR